MVLREFLEFLQERHPGLSQSEIARKAGTISQALVSKVAAGNQRREPQPESYAAIAGAYPDDWKEFLRANPKAAKALYDKHAWALGWPATTATTAAPRTIRARLEELQAEIRTLMEEVDPGRKRRRSG